MLQQRYRSRFVRYNLITVTLLLLVGLIWVYPFLWSVSGAFKTQIGMFTSGISLIPNELDLSNFQRAWVTAGFSEYFFNTLLYSVVATLIELFKSALCGYVLGRYRFPGRNLLYFLIVGTLFVPLATIILPQFLVIESLGLLNTREGVILAFSGAAGALYVLLFTNYFKALPEELFDAAKVDGADFVRLFRLVFPLARPVIATVIIFNFIATWNDFNIPLIYTFSAPDLRNLAVGMFAFQGANSFDWTGFAAGTVISFLPVLLVFLSFQGYFVRGLAGAVKD
ncbi:MAG: carbohydrate ABC transporter permease [Ktedonobacteraceae bacterium]|nr:carbohydrate ABC transporter permease [Ktedonobacteraceae bacterium]MBV9712569.1 carbohydrate ABC transporter permease [Ktedonobacteraceae bacterium]